MRALLLAEGLPEAAIHPEALSRNTVENIRFALPLLARLGAAEVVVVTDRTHAPRALLIARRLGLRASASCPPRRGGDWAATLAAALRELPATALTLWRLRRG
jgi:uncharacterized SAM-binding protein YcdF (DUF218 family)